MFLYNRLSSMSRMLTRVNAKSITQIDDDMREFLAINFRQFFDHIDANGEGYTHNQTEVAHIRENPDALRRIDYSRFLSRVDSGDPDLLAAASAFDSNALIIDMFGAYCTLGDVVVSQAIETARAQARITATDPMHMHLFMIDPLLGMNAQLNRHGLTIEDMEVPDLNSDRVVNGFRGLSQELADDVQREHDVWNAYPYARDTDVGYLDALADRLSVKPHSKDPLKRDVARLRKNFGKVRGDLGYLNRALTRAMDVLERTPFTQYPHVEDELSAASRNYAQAQMIQGSAIRDYANYLSEWQTINGEDGEKSELLRYNGERAIEFEQARALHMRLLSQATMQLQGAVRILNEYDLKLPPRKRTGTFQFINDPEIVSVTPEDIRAYDFLSAVRMVNAKHYAG